MKTLGIKFVNSITVLSVCEEQSVDTISKLLQENKELINEKLGKYNYEKITLKIKPQSILFFVNQDQFLWHIKKN